LRVSSRPEELALVSGGYRAEVERMQSDMLDYLTQPPAQKAVDLAGRSLPNELLGRGLFGGDSASLWTLIPKLRTRAINNGGEVMAGPFLARFPGHC